MNLLLTFIAGLLSRFAPNHQTGALTEDPRPVEEQERDWLHEERILPTGANIYGFTKIVESPYPYLNQLATMSCVPHAVSLAERIERKNDTGLYVSAAPIFTYRQRSNYPAAGTWPPEAFQLIKDNGLPIFSALPTPASEAGANAVVLSQAQKNEAAIYKGKSYFTFGVPNVIDNIASIAAQGHAVPLCLYATYKEYATDYPTVLDRTLIMQAAPIQHEVCVLPYSGFIEKGIKYVTLQDSAWFGDIKIRHLSEDFIKTRVYHAGYWDTVATLAGGPRPRHRFTAPLVVGNTGDEVRQMQLLLISEELLPGDCATGLFGGLTLAGMRAFQNKYAADILTPAGLSGPTSTWGQRCIAKANALCAG